MKNFILSLPIRIGLSVLYILSYLPYRVLMSLGKFLGLVVYISARRRRRITLVNLKLCFPSDSSAEIKRKALNHFRALGMAIMELSICWWWSNQRLAQLFEIQGLEHIDAALKKGHGVILLSAHFTTLEIGGRLLGSKQKFNAVYRKHKTPFFEEFVKRKRIAYSEKTIEKYNIKAMIRSLRANEIVWYAPDQNFTKKNTVLADFFNHPAPTNPATARLAKLTQAAVIPFVQYRKTDGSGYELKILPALSNFPGKDELTDANRINQIFESFILHQPDHYYWVHRKFKRLPEGYPDVYADV